MRRLYKELRRIRRVEEEIARIYPSDKIKSPVHLSIGQEAVSVGVCSALAPDDVVFGTYRGHALFLAKGGRIEQLLAELFGKATGCTKGKGGSMHLIAPEVGMLGASAVVGTTIPNAVGYAYALRIRGSRAIVASFFGDGATEEGVFAESVNFAVLKRLPILFLCENNRYAIHTHQSRRQGLADIVARVKGLGIDADRVDDNDVFAIAAWTRQAAHDARENRRPRFLEVLTYRWREHVGPNEDYDLGYRDGEEARPWKETDQVERVGQLLSPGERAEVDSEVEAEIAAALVFAEQSPWPDLAELHADVTSGPFSACGDRPWPR